MRKPLHPSPQGNCLPGQYVWKREVRAGGKGLGLVQETGKSGQRHLEAARRLPGTENLRAPLLLSVGDGGGVWLAEGCARWVPGKMPFSI